MSRVFGKGCVAKESHPTKTEALRHARAQQRRSGERVTVRRCGFCEQYHVGRNRRGRRT